MQPSKRLTQKQSILTDNTSLFQYRSGLVYTQPVTNKTTFNAITQS